jgi:hypothetical protein
VGAEDVRGGSCTGTVAVGRKPGMGAIVTAGAEPEVGESWSDTLEAAMPCGAAVFCHEQFGTSRGIHSICPKDSLKVAKDRVLVKVHKIFQVSARTS